MPKVRVPLIGVLFVTVLVAASLALGGSAARADDPPTGPKPPPRQVVVRADPTYNPYRVAAPPPRHPDQVVVQAVSFNVNYDVAGCSGGSFSAWPAAAKAAFNYATAQWSALLDGMVTVNVHACWQSDLPAGVLGGASHDWVHAFNFNNEPIGDSWYPSALADQLNGSNTNGAEYDIDATFSSTFSWYYGTDGNTPPGQYDFVSVVMHEIGHGLGFDGLMAYGAFLCGGATSGCWGYGSGYPGVYDRFTENGSNQALLNTSLFPNPSATLGSQLTSNNIYFDGPTARAANGGSRVKLYAPTTWRASSSYAHLDEVFNNTPHALMTYSLSNGESEHHPGAVTLGMFQDMGWTTVSASPPAAPSGLNAVAISKTRIDLSWTDNSSDEDGFKIERSPNGTSGWTQIATVGANVTSYNNTGLTCDTGYYYRVRAYNGNSNSGYSNTANETTTTCPPPNAPSGLNASAISQTQIDLSWTDNSSDEDGFKIERSPNGTSSWTQIATVGANVISHSDSDGLSCGTTYYYRVRAYGENGNSGYSNIDSAKTHGCSGPDAPLDLTVTGATSDQIDLAWTDNSSVEDGYKIWRSPNGATGWAHIGTVGVNGTTFSDTTVVSGSTYYYRVNAYNESGESAYSNTVSATAGTKAYLPLILVDRP